MRMALEEAFFAVGESRPNPAVGAVVVKDGVVVGKGRTQRPGSAHAEVMALRDAGELARGAAIYVTLEPCCHYGRTPPCTKAIIEAGIAKVFYAHGDPNPVVRGNSRQVLEEAGIEVHEGLDACVCAEIDNPLEALSAQGFGKECLCLEGFRARRTPLEIEGAGREIFDEIERYFEAYDYYVRNKRTFVEVKSAVTDEGSMGYVLPDGSRKPLKITGEAADCWNHGLRAMSDGILVGAGTVLADNPGLEVRLVKGNNPVKIVWAGHHEFSREEVSYLRVFTGGSPQENGAVRALVFSCVSQPTIPEAVVFTKSSFADCWNEMLDHLSALGMHRLMVEPGEGLARLLSAAAAVNEGGSPLWNRWNLWQSTDHTAEDALSSFIREGLVADSLNFPPLPEKLVAKESFMVGPDVLTVFYPG
ncbi:MAG: bifunctional diaminohydroxyphosphoribosylaminopyrimidine deaminase/5-amino-6-(5-phosphoribosylamino)uracil reductase RibD [Fibrobacter sp.]|nr:bifunctional diaminohydroxyphosphoribosylaminopyrimidine deaminase/5-amino-6-(5-phosphoribosylamino)uracil reductase RibD [Fibrobacter sp.]